MNALHQQEGLTGLTDGFTVPNLLNMGGAQRTKSGRLYVASDPTGNSRLSRLDCFLRCFAPWAQLILISAPYYGLGALFYTQMETKPCENPLLKSDPTYDAATCREPWTLIDGLYFTTASMSTVGYGDLTVASPGSRLFTSIWIVIGVVVVFTQIAIAFRDGIDRLTRLTVRTLALVSGDRRDTESDAREPLGSPIVFYFKGISVGLFWFLVFQGCISSLILYIDPHLDNADVAWYCFITATTVGYGDVNVHTQGGRLMASVHILLSVIWLAAIIGHLQTLAERRQRQLRHQTMLKRRLSTDIIDGMSRGGEGVDRVGFLVETLIHLGAEIGGEPLSWAHVDPILHQFEAFDVDRDGKLTHKDLERLAGLRGALIGSVNRLRSTKDLVNLVRRANAITPTDGGGAPDEAAAWPAPPLTKRWADGTMYEGEWQGGQPHGAGKTSWADGAQYVGAHRGGLPHGVGVMTYSDGVRWEGEWHDGRRHGRGVRLTPGGKRDEGEWQHGERVVWAEQPSTAVGAPSAMPPAASAHAQGRCASSATMSSTCHAGDVGGPSAAVGAACAPSLIRSIGALAKKPAKTVRIQPEPRMD